MSRRVVAWRSLRRSIAFLRWRVQSRSGANGISQWRRCLGSAKGRTVPVGCVRLRCTKPRQRRSLKMPTPLVGWRLLNWALLG